MNHTAPHYLLITETKTIIDSREQGLAIPERGGQWRFVLEQMGVEARVEVADVEPNVFGERLELLAVVRGLESLDQPSKVTLLTSSRYVGRGIRQGMTQWKSNQWRWERFGRMTVIKNHDLWRRVDHAQQFHTLECRIWDLGQLASHTEAAATYDNKNLSENTFRTRTDSSHRRTTRRPNVIRPHDNLRATARKPFEPQPFSDRESQERFQLSAAKENRNELPINKQRRSVQSVSNDRCNDHQRARCAHQSGTMALVKPPRAGRAYGYAVN